MSRGPASTIDNRFEAPRLRRTDFRVYEPSRYPSVRLDLSVVVSPVSQSVTSSTRQPPPVGRNSQTSRFNVFTGPGVPTGIKR
jgi:hypothetical protein